MTELDELRLITEKIIQPDAAYGDIRNACLQLHQLFYRLTDFTETDLQKEHMVTENGLAVSPYSAAFCIIDFIRTRQFLLAAKKAIEDRLAAHPGKPVTILYAGTGPFATLLTPLSSFFTAAEMKWILLDIHPENCRHLQCLISRLAITDRCADVVCCDATGYQVSALQQPDILLSETMKPGLDKEPYISIIRHLLPQCRSNAILIPASIQVTASYVSNRAGGNYRVQDIARLLECNAELIHCLKENEKEFPVFTDGIPVDLPPAEKGFTKLVLRTGICLYKNICLTENQSSLTIAHVIANLDAISLPATAVVRYETGKKPGFSFRFVQP